MTKPRIGRFTPPDVAIPPIDAAMWQEIENVCKIKLSDDDKERLSDIRAQYIIWRQAEVSGARKEDAEKALQDLEDAATGLRLLARFSSIDDATSAISLPLKKAYLDAKNAVRINSKHLLVIADDNPALVRAIADDYIEPLFVTMSRELLGEISRSVDMSLAAARQSLADGGGFLKGDALQALDRNLTEWAKGKNIATGVSKNNAASPSPYLRMITLLDELSPRELKSFNGEILSSAARIIEIRKKA